MKQAPKYLDAAARRKWRELLPSLSDASPTTLDALTQYSVAWSKWLSADDDAGAIRWSRCCRQWLQELRKSGESGKQTDTTDDPVLRLVNERQA